MRPVPINAATMNPRIRIAPTSPVSPAPSDCAAKATVLMRRNANSQNRQSNSTGRHGDATEQRGVAEPSDRRGGDDADQGRGQVRDHRGTRDGETPARSLPSMGETTPIQRDRIGLYRPRGVPNIRDSSQIGITITAPSRK